MQSRDVIQSQHITTKDKYKNMIQDFVERQNQSKGLLAMNPKLTGAKMGDNPVGKPGTMVVGGDRREQCINVDTNLGEQILAENRKRFPLSFSFRIENQMKMGRGVILIMLDREWINCGG